MPEFVSELISFLSHFIDVILHLDLYLNQWVGAIGPWMYVLLFVIIFCETGLVVTPFLPGDSLLFAVGALAATPDSTLSLPLLAVVMITAGILGDAVNYSIGRYFGPRIFHSSNSRWLNKQHLLRTQHFYEKHGGKTIILARFMPIVRTFAPFVAGIGSMSYPRFATYNIVGAIVWVLLFLVAGFFFGNIPAVKDNFHIVIFAIIIISFAPVAVEFWRAKFSHRPDTMEGRG